MTRLMVEQNSAVCYWEPEDVIVSRSGDVCVVVCCDQWYITYGEEHWRKLVLDLLEQLETYGKETKELFRKTIEVLHEWACSRTYGLGTRLPGDEKWLIESLSDSTIYNAYYTIAHLLQASVFGDVGRVAVDLVDDAFFDAVFLGKDVETRVPEEIVTRARAEFRYWYPVDLRVSGYDLIQNHLTMYLYNHVAIWEDDVTKWPRGIKSAGFLLLNGEKMSKSKGNFLTLDDCISRFGVTALRMLLADGGDGWDAANVAVDTVEGVVRRLRDVLGIAVAVVEEPEQNSFHESLLKATVKRLTREAQGDFDELKFRAGSKRTFDLMLAAWRNYVGAVEAPCRSCQVAFVEAFAIANAPIIPQFCDHLWRSVLRREGTIVDVRWPVWGPPDPVEGRLFFQQRLLDKCQEVVKRALPRGKIKGYRATIYIATAYSELDLRGLSIASMDLADDKAVLAAVDADPELGPKRRSKAGAQIVEFIQFMRVSSLEFGGWILDRTPGVDVVAFFKENRDWFMRKCPQGIREVQFVDAHCVSEGDVLAGTWDDAVRQQARVFQPAVVAVMTE